MNDDIQATSLIAGSLRRQITRLSAEGTEEQSDQISVEEPLEIRLSYQDTGTRREQSISITMRTPGHDAELALGFLAGEAIIHSAQDVAELAHCGPPSPDKGLQNVLRVELADGVDVDLEALKRHFYTSSSCGVCGKASLEAIRVQVPKRADPGFRIGADLLGALPAALRERQDEFARTGGLHASASFSAAGSILRLREDVGRHNALDKLVGSYLAEGGLSQYGVLLSGRASFELIQKAAMAGVRLIAAIGAPSSLAIELAEEQGISLVGFLKAEGFNIYTHPHRILA